MNHQPDFSKLFAEWGESVAAPLSYRVRHDANCPHDVHFLSALIHDATVRSITVKDDVLQLEIDRDTWERYPSRQALDSVPATLRLGPLKSISLQTQNGQDISPGETIDGLDTRRPHPAEDTQTFFVIGARFSIECVVDQFRFDLVLEDHS